MKKNISPENYFDIIAKVKLNSLPAHLIKSHELVLKVTQNGKSWETYKTSAPIKNMMDLYFTKLEVYLNKNDNSSSKQTQKSSQKQLPIHSKTQSPKSVLTKAKVQRQSKLKSLRSNRNPFALPSPSSNNALIKYGEQNKETFQHTNTISNRKVKSKSSMKKITRIKKPSFQDIEPCLELIKAYNQQKAKRKKKCTENCNEKKTNTSYKRSTKKTARSNNSSATKSNRRAKTRKTKTRVYRSGTNYNNYNPNAKQVELLNPEIKIIKRFVDLNNKTISARQVSILVNTLQKYIIEKQISKTSIYAPEIKMIQEKLIKLFNGMKGRTTVQIAPDTLKKLYPILNAQTVRLSVRFIKRYIALQGKNNKIASAKRLLYDMLTAVKNGYMQKSDKYADKINDIYRNLNTFVLDKSRAKVLEISKQELNGLMGLIRED